MLKSSLTLPIYLLLWEASRSFWPYCLLAKRPWEAPRYLLSNSGIALGFPSASIFQWAYSGNIVILCWGSRFRLLLSIEVSGFGLNIFRLELASQTTTLASGSRAKWGRRLDKLPSLQFASILEPGMYCVMAFGWQNDDYALTLNRHKL